MTIANRIAAMKQPHTNDNPLWKGPCGEGELGGITQSMIGKFLSCRERFRLKYILGLEPYDKWNHRLGYGHMWHLCEEAMSAYEGSKPDPRIWYGRLQRFSEKLVKQYPLQQDDINKWFNVCCVQFPEYINYWSNHPDVLNRTPLLQEQVFDVPYKLPSGRIVRLRGRWDSVDLIDGGVWLQENKTKGDVDKLQIERQLKFDLQTNLYLTALSSQEGLASFATGKIHPILGVRYNVVRRPLSGGKGNIRPHSAKVGKGSYTPAESEEAFYERLRRDYIAKEPEDYFFRIKCEITEKDLEVFRNTCLDPLLEQMCWWYDVTIGKPPSSFNNWEQLLRAMNYRTPFGIYSSLEEGGSTEYDAYLEYGSESGLRRVDTLFNELK